MYLLSYLAKMEKEILWNVRVLKNQWAENVNRKILLKDQFSYFQKNMAYRSI